MENNKLEERKTILALLYNQGGFKKADKETKEFRELIDREAKKRNIKPYDLIDYFANHKEELIKTQIPGQLSIFKESKYLKKFKKIYTHSEMENITHQLFKTQKLKDKGIQTVNIPTIRKESITGEVMVWESKGIEYIVKADDILKLEGKNPKVFVSQLKNISLIMAMIQEQQYSELNKKAECRFTLSYYAKRRGYTKEEIQQGGNFFNELKRDLLTGAYTAYRIDKVIIEGKEYIAHGIPNFYRLYEPIDKKNKNWIIRLNEPYKSWKLQILHGKAKQYFITNPKAIEDRITTDNPYLFLFYMQLVKRKRVSLLTMPVSIINLLKDMKLPDKILVRPKECFEHLKEYLIYFSTHYEPIPELESFYLYNDFHKTETVKLPLSISEAFKKYSYIDFKDLLAAIGIRDIRKAYISFKRPYKKPKGYKLNEEENKLLERTLKWFDGQVTKIPKADQESQIKMYIKKYGLVEYERLFEREANKINANAVEFLTKVLPARHG